MGAPNVYRIGIVLLLAGLLAGIIVGVAVTGGWATAGPMVDPPSIFQAAPTAPPRPAASPTSTPNPINDYDFRWVEALHRATDRRLPALLAADAGLRGRHW